MRIIFKNFKLIDEVLDTDGSLVIDNGIIAEIGKNNIEKSEAGLIIDGKKLAKNSEGFGQFKSALCLMPAFIDLHAHFRDPGFLEKETIESACMSAAAGGYTTVVCMANTNPVTDKIEKACTIRNRSNNLGLTDCFPVLSISENMEGKKLSEITKISSNWKNEKNNYKPLLISEDGKDIEDDDLMLAAMHEAKRIDIPISFHCDFGGEINAVSRVIELGKKTGCHIHIAHVSKKEAVELIRCAKNIKLENGFKITCEAMPHHLALTDKDAYKLGADSFGRVNPPLRSEEDRLALIEGLIDGTIDAIATDHAPHTIKDKEKGAPGFSGLETSFAVCFTELVRNKKINLQFLSKLMSAIPARILDLDNKNTNSETYNFQLGKRGRILPGYKADLVLVDCNSQWTIDPKNFKTKGKNSPFSGKKVYGKILITVLNGRIIYSQWEK